MKNIKQERVGDDTVFVDFLLLVMKITCIAVGLYILMYVVMLVVVLVVAFKVGMFFLTLSSCRPRYTRRNCGCNF